MTKNTDIEKYKYSGYGIGFDRKGSFSFPGGEFGQNVLIFGADMSSSPHIDNKKKRYISSWERTNTRVRKYFKCRKTFTVTKNKFSLSLHYNGANSYLFVNGQELIKFKAKDSEIVASPLCLGNISRDWSADNIKRTGFNGYVYEFHVDYKDRPYISEAVPFIHKYFMLK